MTTPAADASLHDQLKAMIVETLMLEDVDPADIEDQQVLFGEGLGLDSVDALELAMEIERRYGVTVPNDEQGREVFKSVAALASFVQRTRAAAAG